MRKWFSFLKNHTFAHSDVLNNTHSDAEAPGAALPRPLASLPTALEEQEGPT